MSRVAFIPIPYKARDMAGSIRTAAEALLQQVGAGFRQDFARTYATWGHKPDFATKVERGRDWSMTVSTNDLVYHFVSGGTVAHLIPKMPKTDGPLAFRWDGPGSYRAKTQPGALGSGGGGPSGPMHFPRQVRHPGTVARKFDAAVAEKWQKVFPRMAQEAFTRAINDAQRQ